MSRIAVNSDFNRDFHFDSPLPIPYRPDGCLLQGFQPAWVRSRDDLEHSNQDSQSRPDCSYRGNLTRSARQIARRDTGSRWLSQPRRIAAPPRLCARSASLRTFRYSTAPGRSSTTGANPVSVSVRMRGPPRHTTRFLKAGGSRKVCRPSFEKGQVAACGLMDLGVILHRRRYLEKCRYRRKRISSICERHAWARRALRASNF